MADVLDSQTGEVFSPFIEKPLKEYTRHVSPVGEKTYRKTRYYIDPETGERCAEPGDEVNLDAYIQSSAAATDLATIYEAFKEGDETVVNVGRGIYGDMTQLPTNINDVVASQKVIDTASKSFDALPDEVKELFGNDVNAYFNALLENRAKSMVQAYYDGKKKAEPQEQKEGE